MSRKKKELWLVFRLRGDEICAYTIRGTFQGEVYNTKELLAQQHGCKPYEIETTVEERETE